MSDLAIKKVVVAGGGSIAWIAAAALRRTLKNTGIDVTVVDTPEAGAPLARWTLPSQRGAHAQIGLNEADFLRQADATYRLASEYLGWQGDGSRYVHVHGEIGSPIEVTPFYKLLLAQALRGKVEKPEAYSVAALAARLGRFARPMGSGNAVTANFTYGYHLDERTYIAILRAQAEGTGVQTVAGNITGVKLREDGDIESLVLDSGQTMAGDLFLDCTGTAGSLISQLDAQPRIDWRRWAPCDRKLSVFTSASSAPPALTGIMAGDAGWMFKAPLARANFVGHVYSSAHLDDEAALNALQRVAGPLGAVPELMRLNPGRRDRSWVRNCVALGGAAMEIESLAGAELHQAQLGLATLLELFPLDRRGGGEAAEFNRIVGEYADSLRDFTHAHYLLSRRPGAFWEASRAVEPPATLAVKLDLYSAGGRIDIRDHEIFEETDWVWLLMGAGLLPRALEWQIARAISVVGPSQVTELRDHIARLAGSMPRHVDFLERVITTPPRSAGVPS
jgi:tryptophan halogenase